MGLKEWFVRRFSSDGKLGKVCENGGLIFYRSKRLVQSSQFWWYDVVNGSAEVDARLLRFVNIYHGLKNISFSA